MAASRGLQKLARLSLKPQGRQDAGGVGPRIQPDAPLIDMHLLSRRMAVNDELFEGAGMVQKHLSHPHELLRILAIQRHAGLGAGVGEEVVAEGKLKIYLKGKE